MSDLVPAGSTEVVEGVIVGGELQPAGRPWQTQAERDRTIINAAEVFDRIRGRLSANTRAAYKAAWGKFIRWCQETSRTPYPLTLAVLLSYLGHLSKVEVRGGRRGVSASTVDIFLAAARRVVLADRDPDDLRGWVGAHQDVTDWVANYRKERNESPETRPRRSAGARQAIMRALLDVLPGDDRGVRDRAIMLLAYYMGARRSEVMALTHADVRWTVDGLEVYIARSKTDQQGLGEWVAIPRNAKHEQYDPWTALEEWLAVCRREGHTSGPLFRAINRWGQIRAGAEPMSGQAMSDVVTRAWLEAFRRAKAAAEHPHTKREVRKAARAMVNLLDPDKVHLTPHSFRRGFATDARAAGWDLLEIARAGRWSPRTRVLHIYIEEVERWLRHQNNPMPL